MGNFLKKNKNKWVIQNHNFKPFSIFNHIYFSVIGKLKFLLENTIT